MTNIEFIDSPPFLLFDIASSFWENINSLDALPRQISVYGETYRLGCVTSFVSSREHYVGYIVENEGFLFYDGLPTDNPFLHKYSKSRIQGDISLLCYLPLDDVNYVQIPSDDVTKTLDPSKAKGGMRDKTSPIPPTSSTAPLKKSSFNSRAKTSNITSTSSVTAPPKDTSLNNNAKTSPIPPTSYIAFRKKSSCKSRIPPTSYVPA